MEAKIPSTGIVATAQAYQLAMLQQPAIPAEAESTEISSNPPPLELIKDATMTDQSVEVVWHNDDFGPVC